MRLTMSVAALTLVSALAAPAQEAQKVTLEWKFAKGDKLRYEYSAKVDSDGGDFETETTYGLAMEVVSVDEKDGTATIKATFDRIKLKYTDGDDDVDFDSDKGKKPAKDDVPATTIVALIGKPLDLKLSRRGQVLKLTGIDKVAETFEKDDSDDDEDGGQAGPSFTKHFSDDIIEGQIQSEFGQLAEKPVAKGEAWKNNLPLPEPTSFAVGGGRAWPSKFTLKEIRDGAKEVVISQDGGPTRDDVEGSVKSDRVWDVEKGRLQSSKRKSSFSAGDQGATLTYTAEMKFVPEKAKAK